MAGPLATLGPVRADSTGTPIVAQARNLGVASGVLSQGGQAFVVGAARVPPGKQRASNAVVILGGPLDRAALENIAQAAAAPVAISDGRKVLVAAGLASVDFATTGPDDAQAALAALVGREDRAIVDGVVDVGGGRSGTAWPLVTVSPAETSSGARLWLLALVPAAPMPTAPLAGLIIAVTGALLGASGLVVQLSSRTRRKARGDVAAGDPVLATTIESTGEIPPPTAIPPPAPTRNGSARAPDTAVADRGGLRGGRLTPPAGRA